MITRAKTRGELAIQRTRMERLQKERIAAQFEEAEVLERTPGSRRMSVRGAPPHQRKQTRVELLQATALGSSVVLSLEAQHTSPKLCTAYVHLPGDWYRIQNLPIKLFNEWVPGFTPHGAKSDDIRYYKRGPKKGTRKTPRWWKTKNPSWGAFMNQKILGVYKFEKIPGPPATGTTDVFGGYYDDDNDVYGEPITNG